MPTEVANAPSSTTEESPTDKKSCTNAVGNEKEMKEEGDDSASHESKSFTTGTPQPEGVSPSQNGELPTPATTRDEKETHDETQSPSGDGSPIKEGEEGVTANQQPLTLEESRRNFALDLEARYPVIEAGFLAPSLLPIEHPKPHDILFGRGGLTNHHIGNRKFRDMISEHKEDYLNSSKVIKPRIARSIVNKIRTCRETPGRFLKKKDDGLWYDVGDKQAVEKVAQGLREKTPFQKKEIKAKAAAATEQQESQQMYPPGPPYPMPPGPHNQPNPMYMNYMMPYPPYGANGMMTAPFHGPPPHPNMMPHYGFSPYKVAETLEERKEAELRSPSKEKVEGKVEPSESEQKDTKDSTTTSDETNNVALEESKENVPLQEKEESKPLETPQTSTPDVEKTWKVEGGIFGKVDSEGRIIVTEHDILCGRGGATNHHKGNKRFRDIVATHRPDYIRAPKVQKPAVARLIVKAIRTGVNPGRFLKKDGLGHWFDIGDKKAAEKSSQALREKGTDDRRTSQPKQGEYYGFIPPTQGWQMPHPFYGYYPPGAMPMPQHFMPGMQTMPIPPHPAEKQQEISEQKNDGTGGSEKVVKSEDLAGKDAGDEKNVKVPREEENPSDTSKSSPTSKVKEEQSSADGHDTVEDTNSNDAKDQELEKDSNLSLEKKTDQEQDEKRKVPSNDDCDSSPSPKKPKTVEL